MLPVSEAPQHDDHDHDKKESVTGGGVHEVDSFGQEAHVDALLRPSQLDL